MNETSNPTLRGPTTGPAFTATLEPVTMPGSGMSDAAHPGVAAAPAPVPPSAPSARPGVVQLAIREKAALHAAYMPFIDGGGLFVPTTRVVNLGDELYLILSLVDDPNKLSVTGKVVWITPAGTPGRQQGLAVQFAKNDSGQQARARIETLLGGLSRANRATHTI